MHRRHILFAAALLLGACADDEKKSDIELVPTIAALPPALQPGLERTTVHVTFAQPPGAFSVQGNLTATLPADAPVDFLDARATTSEGKRVLVIDISTGDSGTLAPNFEIIARSFDQEARVPLTVSVGSASDTKIIHVAPRATTIALALPLTLTTGSLPWSREASLSVSIPAFGRARTVTLSCAGAIRCAGAESTTVTVPTATIVPVPVQTVGVGLATIVASSSGFAPTSLTFSVSAPTATFEARYLGMGANGVRHALVACTSATSGTFTAQSMPSGLDAVSALVSRVSDESETCEGTASWTWTGNASELRLSVELGGAGTVSAKLVPLHVSSIAVASLSASAWLPVADSDPPTEARTLRGRVDATLSDMDTTTVAASSAALTFALPHGWTTDSVAPAADSAGTFAITVTRPVGGVDGDVGVTALERSTTWVLP